MSGFSGTLTIYFAAFAVSASVFVTSSPVQTTTSSVALGNVTRDYDRNERVAVGPDPQRSDSGGGGGDGDTTTAKATTGRYPSTWVAKLFYETLVDFAVHADVGSSACRQQTKMYTRHLANDSYWAVQSEWYNH